MKLSKLYSNHPNLFQEILFESGLNVVLAEIRLPENKKKDTHNLGKTTLGHLLNFLLLARRNPKFFLFKHLEQFQKFIFFLNWNYLMVRILRFVEAYKMQLRLVLKSMK